MLTPDTHSAGVPQPRTLALPRPGAAVCRHKGSKSQPTPRRASPADLREAPLPWPRPPGCRLYLVHGRCVRVADRPKPQLVHAGDSGVTLPRASSAAAGAGSSARARADSARPAPPRLSSAQLRSSSQGPPQPGGQPLTSAPPSAATALSPGRSSVGLLQPRPARFSWQGPGASAHAHRETHQWRESAREAGQRGRGGVDRRVLDSSVRGREKACVSEED